MKRKTTARIAFFFNYNTISELDKNIQMVTVAKSEYL